MTDLETLVIALGGPKKTSERLGIHIRTLQLYRSGNNIPERMKILIRLLLRELGTSSIPPGTSTGSGH